MEHYALIISVLILGIHYSTSSDDQSPDASLQEHVKKLDEMLAEIQSHSQDQEQSLRAILSHLLSQLTKTSDELEHLKTSQNETILKLEKRDAEFWASHNATTLKLDEKEKELSELVAIHNATVLNLEGTVTKLEGKDAELSKVLAEMQSQSQAQEQKYSAVLSSLLSQMTQTTDKLEDLKSSYNINETIQSSDKRAAELSELWASHNETIGKLDDKDAQFAELSARYNETVLKLESTVLKLAEKDAEISKLWASQNGTLLNLESTSLKLKETNAELSKLRACQNETSSESELTSLKLKVEDEELSKLWACYNATVLDLNELQAKHNDVVVELEGTKSKFENFENRRNPNGFIGFQGSLSKGKNATADEPIVFDTIMYSTGVYNKSTGKLTIPMNGTYQIWINIAYQRSKGAFVFAIHKDHHYIDQAFGRLSHHEHETTATMAMVYLQKGQSIWISPTSDVYLDPHFCKFGIVLLNAN